MEAALAGGWCRVRVKQSGLLWSIRDHSAAPLARLVQDTEQRAAQFRLEQAGAGWYKIRIKHSGLVLDVTGERNSEPLAEVVQFSAHEGDNQRFSLEPASDGWVRMRVKQSGLVLDVTGERNSEPLAQVVQFAAHHGDNQVFCWEPVGPTATLTAARISNVVFHVDFTQFDGSPDALAELFKAEKGGGGWGNGELQYYTDAFAAPNSPGANAWVEPGQALVIEARRERMGSNSHTSARLVTKEGWRYGEIEVVAKLPSGLGTWPAIWMLPAGEFKWPADGEIDIMEHVGHDCGVVHSNVHTEAYNHLSNTNKGASVAVPAACERFHRYAVRWTPEVIEAFVGDEVGGDMRRYFVFENERRGRATWPFDRPFQLVLNVAVGGSWGGQRGVGDWTAERMLVRKITVKQ